MCFKADMHQQLAWTTTRAATVRGEGIPADWSLQDTMATMAIAGKPDACSGRLDALLSMAGRPYVRPGRHDSTRPTRSWLFQQWIVSSNDGSLSQTFLSLDPQRQKGVCMCLHFDVNLSLYMCSKSSPDDASEIFLCALSGQVYDNPPPVWPFCF
ncbi:hypothetical protein BDZ89DRAFT_100697 [Hymenopellis radicata]|nr:hypothetical protein BDZ89DRAFT_100697 [Hymenopellis radicata]